MYLTEEKRLQARRSDEVILSACETQAKYDEHSSLLSLHTNASTSTSTSSSAARNNNNNTRRNSSGKSSSVLISKSQSTTKQRRSERKNNVKHTTATSISISISQPETPQNLNADFNFNYDDLTSMMPASASATQLKTPVDVGSSQHAGAEDVDIEGVHLC